jgi:hypothetical protein
VEYLACLPTLVVFGGFTALIWIGAIGIVRENSRRDALESELSHDAQERTAMFLGHGNAQI